jgi:hypothetical protein
MVTRLTGTELDIKAEIDATVINATCFGHTMGDVFGTAQAT